MEKTKKAEKRDKHEIIRDLLEIARPGSIKTRLVYQGNLNFKVFSKYLEIMTRAGLIVKTLNCYFTTEKGLNYIEEFNRVPQIF